MVVGLGIQMTDQGTNGHVDHAGKKDDKQREKRRLMLTQLLRSPVLNPAGSEVGRVEDFIVKLAEGGGYPPFRGWKVGVGGQHVLAVVVLVDNVKPVLVGLDSSNVMRRRLRLRPGNGALCSL